ncbi:MAG: GIY-YIG nuclease family protein [Cyclobacteriaceae bacterium]|nr:GIY-YIG nuclease family protein [Cyclobacteriaceae bacterium]
MERGGTVYIITNKHHTVFYVGVTSELVYRIIEHRDKLYPKSFSAKYNVSKLVYYEHFASIKEAIEREKYLKGKVRKFKLDLIETMNPEWRDLAEDVLKW